MSAPEPRAGRETKFWVFGLITVLATGLRLADYLARHSLNHDESAVAVNLIRRSFSGLLRPLDFWQVAPIGFLWTEKVFGQLLGYSEWSLRLFPLIVGIALTPIFLFIVNDLFDWRAACIGGLLLGTERRLIDWSARLKPYGLDAVLALITLYIISLGIRRKWSPRYLFLAAIWGAVAQWFSFPLILVLAAMGAVAIVDALRNRQWRTAALLVGVCLIWIGSFVINRSLAMNIGATRGHMDQFWDQYFVPHSWRVLTWFPWALLMIFGQTVRLGSLPMLPLLILLGAVGILWRTRRLDMLLAISPIGPALLAAAMDKYPFGDRLLLYMVPLLVLIMAAALARMMEWPSTAAKLLGCVLVLAMLVPDMAVAARRAVRPPASDETRPMYAYIVAHHHEADHLYIAFFAIPSYEYYSSRMPLKLMPAAMESEFSSDSSTEDLPGLSGRVWFVSDGLNDPTRDQFFAHLIDLAHQRGPELDHFQITHVQARLFDLQKAATTPLHVSRK